MIERGMIESVTIGVMKKIADVIGIKLSKLLKQKEN